MVSAERAVRERVRRVVSGAPGTQGEFAARIGLDASKLSRSLGGTRRFTLAELARIADVTGVSADWLLTGSGVGPAEPVPAGSPGAGGARPGDGAAPAADRRSEFLRATWRLIAERGYHAVRVADIARVCGTSSAAIHYYFPGKEDLLNEALRHCVEQAFERQSAQLRGVEDGRERLLKLIDMQLPRPGQVRAEWSIWLQYWAEAALRPELRTRHHEFYTRWRETIVRVIARGQRQGCFRSDLDATEAALRFTALTDGVAIQLLTGAPDMSLERMRDLLVGFVRQELDA